MARDIDVLIRRAKKQGWKVDRTTSGHVRFTNPKGERYTTGGTPGASHSIKNLKSDLKRRGLVYDQKGGRRRRRLANSDDGQPQSA